MRSSEWGPRNRKRLRQQAFVAEMAGFECHPLNGGQETGNQRRLLAKASLWRRGRALDSQLRHFFVLKDSVDNSTGSFLFYPMEAFMQDQIQIQHPKYISQSAAAESLGVSERTIARWVRTGKLRAFRLHNVTRIVQADFEKFLEKYSEIPNGEEVPDNV
jgi:excisionase family DNA binding protein